MTQVANQSVTMVPAASQNVVAIRSIELAQKLLGLRKGANFCTIETRTEPAIKKGSGRGLPPANPFYGNCFKRARVNGAIQFDYESNVNAQRDREGKEGDFVAKAPTWGTRIDNSCIVEYEGEYYFYFRPL